MKKTKEEKNQYCREWRIKNREKYLSRKKTLYRLNRDRLRDKAKERARKYYYEVEVLKRKLNVEKYRSFNKIQNAKRLQKRRDFLLSLRIEKGGKCVDCGYSADIDILQFHHISKKVDNVTNFQSIKKMANEAKKCILLCPNCHALRHKKNNDKTIITKVL